MRFSPLVERIGGERAEAWEIHSEAVRRQRAGHDVILLSVGDSDHDTPPAVVQAAIDALWAGKTKYTGTIGNVELRQAIVERQRHRHGQEINIDQVLAVNTSDTGSAGFPLRPDWSARRDHPAGAGQP